MKIWAWGAVVAATVAVAACGNGGSTATGTTAGNSGGSVGPSTTSSTGVSSMHTVSSATSTGGVTTGPGSGGTGGTGGSASACGSLMWDNTNMPCNQCMLDNCCDKLSACDTGTPCGDLIACTNACAMGDNACIKTCQTTDAAGQNDLNAVFTCYDANCATTQACGTQICMSGVIVADKTCGTCLTTNCCAQFTACTADATCKNCIGSTSAACMTNALLVAANACQDASTTAMPPGCGQDCAGAICDTGLGYQGAPACNYCLGQKDAQMGCCEEMEACKADATCLSCITGMTSGAMCTADMPYTKFNTCRTANCATPCGG